MLDLVREIAQSLRHNKLRTALTGFAVAWGIFMLIVLLGMSRGIFNAFDSSMMSQSSNYLLVWGGRTEKPYKGYKEGRRIGLKHDDVSVVDDGRSVRISGATPVKRSSSQLTVSTPKDYVSGTYSGVYPEMSDIDGVKVIAGRFINQSDINYRRKVMSINKTNAEVLFDSIPAAIGKSVKCNGLAFTIVGVYDSEWRSDIYIPYTTARMLASGDDNIDQLTVSLRDVNTLEAGEKVEKDVRTALANAHDFEPEDNSAVWVWNRLTQHIQTSTGLSILNYAIWIIGILTMLSGIVGVSNIMFVSVRERTHEIGIRRAIGAKPRSVLTQVIVESVAITALFGYIGIFFGIIANEGLASAFEGQEWICDPSVNLLIAIEVTVVLVISGALAGLFPALKALKVKPVEALRTE